MLMLKRFARSAGVITAVGALLTVPAVAAAQTAPTQNIVQIAADNPNFSTLVGLVTKAGLADTLSSGQYTVFAPTNAAFAKLPKAQVAKISSNPALLQRVLLGHVVSGAVPAATVVTLNEATTLSGAKVKIRVSGGSVFLNGKIKVTTTDIMATNGVIHVVDSVILPVKQRPTIVGALAKHRQFSTLVNLVTKAGLVDELSTGNYTVFAPTNRAFAKLPKATLDAVANDPDLLKSVLLYHVVSGKATARQAVRAQMLTTLQGGKLTVTQRRGKIRVNGTSRVIFRNAMTSNGIIHVIDGVLVPKS
jgi:transforming growth factor-beta-induced protein